MEECVQNTGVPSQMFEDLSTSVVSVQYVILSAHDVEVLAPQEVELSSMLSNKQTVRKSV